jgi:Tfp pilus assembly PilM family ATPase
VRALGERLKVPIVAADPFRNIGMDEGDRDYLQSIGPAAAVAVGLALRCPGDA